MLIAKSLVRVASKMKEARSSQRRPREVVLVDGKCLAIVCSREFAARELSGAIVAGLPCCRYQPV
jgi:hypothetical protein